MSKEINRFLLDKAEDFLTTLDQGLGIENYQHLGYTSHSIIKVVQTALLTEIEHPEWTDHNTWDIYNLLNLLSSLIPEPEFEFLDKIKKGI